MPNLVQYRAYQKLIRNYSVHLLQFILHLVIKNLISSFCTLMYNAPESTSYLYLVLLMELPGPMTLSPTSCQNWKRWLSSLLGHGSTTVDPTFTSRTIVWPRPELIRAAKMTATSEEVCMLPDITNVFILLCANSLLIKCNKTVRIYHTI